MVTKRGTNNYHGAGYECYFETNDRRGEHLAANNTPLVGGVAIRTSDRHHRNRYGGSLGGPLIPKYCRKDVLLRQL